jgi:hypothetical protein
VRTIHAWDCRCGTRNAPAFVHCRRCDGPQNQGRPVAGSDPAQIAVLPARNPDDWLQIQINSPISYDIWQAIMGMVAAIGFVILGYVLFLNATH